MRASDALPLVMLAPTAPHAPGNRRMSRIIGIAFIVVGLASFAINPQSLTAKPFAILAPSVLAPHVDHFNTMEPETVVNEIPNAKSLRWLEKNIPRFECPDPAVAEMYYFRWWSFRKHLKKTPHGFIITEFLTPVSHADEFNAISCATGLHLAEGRWLRDSCYIDDYAKFWLTSNHGQPAKKFHNFSSWFAAALWDRYQVTGDKTFLIPLLPDLVADYRTWERERQLTNGLFWQFDVRDGMEESISGSRRLPNIRPTINSYMVANARALAAMAQLAKQPSLAAEFSAKAERLRQLTLEQLWDPSANFFKVLVANTNANAPGQYSFSDAREAVGFVPWMFGLPDGDRRFDRAWEQATDPMGFAAPFGLTTAERRHPEFRNRGVGTCEWDGAIWPFASSQTLYAWANHLRARPNAPTQDYFAAFLTYTRSQSADGRPYIGEYQDEITGEWIDGKNDRSRYYNHSTYADLLITGIIGLQPQTDASVLIAPLLPAGTWEWFCLDGLKYRGHDLTVVWDQTGKRYGRGAGLILLVDGKEFARSPRLTKISASLP